MLYYASFYQPRLSSYGELIMDFKKVCIIIPCFNEAVTLPLIIKQIKKIDSKIQILVIDNASTDNSYKIASRFGVKVIKESKKGKGYAVKKGFSNLGAGACVT